MGWNAWREENTDNSENISSNTLDEMNRISSEVGQMSEDADRDAQNNK